MTSSQTMFYKVIEYFGPHHSAWHEFSSNHYIRPLLSFDSIDGILCPDVFHPQTEEDWANCVQENFKTSLITDLEYAKKVSALHSDCRLIGVEENRNCDNQPGLLGYDILDEHNYVSIITNWGPQDLDHPLRLFSVGTNGLILSFDVASKAASFLRKEYPSADHASGATVWAVFSAGPNKSFH